MTIKNKIAEYLGFIPYSELLKEVKTIQTACEQHRDKIIQASKIDMQVLIDNLHKPEPKLKADVRQIIAAILSQDYKQIGHTQDEFMYIYQFATVDKMFWLQVNYEGEYVYLMQQINNQDINNLCEWITTPNKNKDTAIANLETVSTKLESERRALEIANESTNTTEYRKLTAREKKTLSVLKFAVALVREVSVLVRDL